MRVSGTDETERDGEIQARLEAGDPSAIELMWDCYAGDLLGYLMTMLCSRHDAEDALQEIFVRVAQKRRSVAQARSLKPYLFGMARNRAINLIKRRKRRDVLFGDADRWLVCNKEAGNDGGLIDQATEALQALPESQRSVVVLKICQGRTFREIAGMLDVSENTAASRYRYGIAKLRKLMKEEL